MCGVVGFFKGLDCAALKGAPIAHLMADTLTYRGPDDYGVWSDDRTGITLAHRRLSILDLSSAGHQPMVSRSDRYVIAFNGEIYNFLELRAELENDGVTFKSHTDTEVILELYAREGSKCLDKLNGMFAFALWDKNKQELFIARDRLGKKPLYY
mgnify:CR=1 FL=1